MTAIRSPGEGRGDRITLAMTPFYVVMALGGGNPGALTVCMKILADGERIDPDGFAGGLGLLLLMDTFRIYEHRIWMLYKDVCGEDLVRMVGLLRACQLGKIGQAALSHAIDSRGEGIDVDALVTAVRERLPRFGGAAAESAVSQ